MRCEGFGCIEKAKDGTQVLGCDTVYAVNKEHFGRNWIEISSPQQLLNVFELYDLPEGVDVVLTGGEPLIYAHDPIFVSFLEQVSENGHRITFETNATILPDFEKYPIYKKSIFALSVKLENSGESLHKRLRGDVINALAENAHDAFFKFSVDEDSINMALDDEIDQIRLHAPKLGVYCMPLGGNKTDVEKNTLPLIEYCKNKGYNFSDRLHIRIWDENKGV